MSRVVSTYLLLTAAAIGGFAGLVTMTNRQLAQFAPIDFDGQDAYPAKIEARIAAGRDVYARHGCVYCHSQQVRAASYGADHDRGWGTRRTVPRDYVHESPPLLGTSRTGPDLSNIAIRQPSDDWHLLHLYDPRLVVPDSLMPPHPFLFRVVDAGSVRQDAVAVPAAHGADEQTIVPTEQAIALVAYLQSLARNRPLPEVR